MNCRTHMDLFEGFEAAYSGARLPSGFADRLVAEVRRRRRRRESFRRGLRIAASVAVTTLVAYCAVKTGAWDEIRRLFAGTDAAGPSAMEEVPSVDERALEELRQAYEEFQGEKAWKNADEPSWVVYAKAEERTRAAGGMVMATSCGPNLCTAVLSAKAVDTSWVWTNNADSAACAPSKWSRTENWSAGVPLKASDCAHFTSSHTNGLALPIVRYIRVPEGGLAVAKIQNSVNGTCFSYLVGDSLSISTLKGAVGGCNWGLNVFNDVVSPGDMLLDGKMTLFGTVESRGVCRIVRHYPEFVLGRKASASTEEIVNPSPTNIVFSSLGGLRIAAPRWMEKDVTAEGCTLAAGSSVVTGATLNAVARLTAGCRVECEGVLPEGTYLRAVYTRDCVELSAPPLSTADPARLRSAALTFKAFRPNVRQTATWSSLTSTNRITVLLDKSAAGQVLRYRVAGGLPEMAGEVVVAGGGDYGSCGTFVLEPSPAFHGAVSVGLTERRWCNVEFPTNAQGVAGLSADPRAGFAFNGAGYGLFGQESIGVSVSVPEPVETLPVACAPDPANPDTCGWIDKKGAGTLALNLVKGSFRRISVREGAVRLLSPSAAFSLADFEPSPGTGLFIAAGGTASVMNGYSESASTGVVRVEAGATLVLRTASDLAVDRLELGEGSRLEVRAKYAEVRKALTVGTLVIGGNATVDADLVVTDGIEVDLNGGGPGCIDSRGTLVLPRRGLVRVVGRPGQPFGDIYPLLLPSAGTTYAEGGETVDWTAEADSSGLSCRALFEEGRHEVEIVSRGLVIIFM